MRKQQVLHGLVGQPLPTQVEGEHQPQRWVKKCRLHVSDEAHAAVDGRVPQREMARAQALKGVVREWVVKPAQVIRDMDPPDRGHVLEKEQVSEDQRGQRYRFSGVQASMLLQLATLLARGAVKWFILKNAGFIATQSFREYVLPSCVCQFRAWLVPCVSLACQASPPLPRTFWRAFRCALRQLTAKSGSPADPALESPSRRKAASCNWE